MVGWHHQLDDDMSLSKLRELVMDKVAWRASVHGVRVQQNWATELETEEFKASLVSQMVMNLPAMQETWVQSLCWENPLEKEMATHSSILAWEIPWTEEPGIIHRPAKSQTRLKWLRTLTLILRSVQILWKTCPFFFFFNHLPGLSMSLCFL